MAYNNLAVSNPATTNLTDGSNPIAAGGRQGETLVRELGGKYYTSAVRGRLFMTQGAIAGNTIPISSATAATFAVYNPIGSGIVMALGKLNVSITNATTVVSSISWGIITGLTVAPTSLTAIATGPGYLGSNYAAIGQVYSAATLAAAASKFFGLFSVSATAGAFPNFNYDHEGSIVLYPGSLVHLVGNAAQTSATVNSLTWEEWPLV